MKTILIVIVAIVLGWILYAVVNASIFMIRLEKNSRMKEKNGAKCRMMIIPIFGVLTEHTTYGTRKMNSGMEETKMFNN